jgi:hypothetical protein
MEGRPAMVVTHLWTDSLPNHYEERQEAFEKYIKKTMKDLFTPSFEAKCREYYRLKHAEKHLTRELKAAEKYDAIVIPVEWRWTPDGRKDRGP